LNDIWRGRLIGRTVHLRFWRMPSAEIPRTTEERIAWLDGQWERVDAWVAALTEPPPSDDAKQLTEPMRWRASR
jgi:hypothetical protein